MNLTLTIISSANPQLAQGQVFELGDGGSIGRGASNSCILPDDEKVISGSHATVELQAAGFVLIDHSTNGTFLNGSLSPTGRDVRTELNDGDQLTIGKYVLAVAILAAATAPPPAAPAPPQPSPPPSSSFLDDFSTAPAAAPVPAAAPQNPTAPAHDDLDKWLTPQTPQPTPAFAPLGAGLNTGALVDLQHRELDPLKALDSASAEPGDSKSILDNDQNWWQEPQQDSAPAIQHAAHVPQPIIQQPVAPPQTPAQSFFAESTATASAQPSIPPAQAPAPPSQPPPAQPPAAAQAPVSGALGALVASELGLQGLTEQQVAELVPELIAITQQASGRLMSSLKARATIKSELGMQRTIIQPVENNPLKFSADVDGAINYLFGEQGGSFMGPQQAINDSFNDLEDHQMAILIGMKSAYNTMLAAFSPEAIGNQLNISSGSGPLRKIKSAQLWEAYERNYVELVSDAEYTYNKLFGEAFAIAYEEQVSKLKAARVSN